MAKKFTGVGEGAGGSSSSLDELLNQAKQQQEKDATADEERHTKIATLISDLDFRWRSIDPSQRGISDVMLANPIDTTSLEEIRAKHLLLRDRLAAREVEVQAALTQENLDAALREQIEQAWEAEQEKFEQEDAELKTAAKKLWDEKSERDNNVDAAETQQREIQEFFRNFDRQVENSSTTVGERLLEMLLRETDTSSPAVKWMRENLLTDEDRKLLDELKSAPEQVDESVVTQAREQVVARAQGVMDETLSTENVVSRNLQIVNEITEQLRVTEQALRTEIETLSSPKAWGDVPQKIQTLLDEQAERLKKFQENSGKNEGRWSRQSARREKLFDAADPVRKEVSKKYHELYDAASAVSRYLSTLHSKKYSLETISSAEKLIDQWNEIPATIQKLLRDLVEQPMQTAQKLSTTKNNDHDETLEKRGHAAVSNARRFLMADVLPDDPRTAELDAAVWGKDAPYRVQQQVITQLYECSQQLSEQINTEYSNFDTKLMPFPTRRS